MRIAHGNVWTTLPIHNNIAFVVILVWMKSNVLKPIGREKADPNSNWSCSEKNGGCDERTLVSRTFIHLLRNTILYGSFKFNRNLSSCITQLLVSLELLPSLSRKWTQCAQYNYNIAMDSPTLLCRALYYSEYNSRVDPQECTWYFVMLDYPAVYNSRAVKLGARRVQMTK